MQTRIRHAIWGKTPEEKQREADRKLKRAIDKLQKDIDLIKKAEDKAQKEIQDHVRRGQRNPALAQTAAQSARTLAAELVHTRKQRQRLETQKALFESVRSQVKTVYGLAKTRLSLKGATDVMKQMNSMIQLPELTDVTQDLSRELTKMGVHEEMIDDMMPEMGLMEGEEEEADEEVDKVLSEILGDKLPTTKAKVDELPAQPVEEDEEEDQEEVLAQMRGRLQALKS